MNSISQRIVELSDLAINKWGAQAQMVKTCEELAELQVQLCKRINGSPTTEAQIIDEIADVLIMANQMSLIYGPAAVEARMHYKLTRLAKALGHEETPHERL